MAPDTHTIQAIKTTSFNATLQGSRLSNMTLAGLNATNATYTGLDDDEDRVDPAVAILLLYAFLLLIIGAQAALFYWKQKHKRSYELVTLLGLWMMPAVFSIQLHFWRFLAVWGGFSITTAYILSLCIRKKTLASTTPRKVYTWFLGAYKISTAIGMTGYIMLICEIFGLGIVFDLILPKGTSILLIWYGLYFGVLGRDCAEVAADQMALAMGSGRKLTSLANSCGICGNELQDFSHMGEESSAERCVQLNCKHCFHELCVRGWTMVGKKDTCPVCLEKVDLRSVHDRPWDSTNLNWIQMLDSIRYLVVWNPLIFMAFSLLSHLVPHHHHHHHNQPPMPPPAGLMPPKA